MLVTIREKWTSRYLMMIDLDAIERSCGVKIKDPNDGTWHVDLSIAQTKKIFKYMRRHIWDEEQMQQIDDFMSNSKNQKMVKAWDDTIPKKKKQ